MTRIAVLASGRGSNFQAVIDRVQDGSIPADIVRLITDNPFAYAIQRARDADIPVEIVDYSTFSDKGEYEKALLRVMKKCDPDLIILAGYMRILGTSIVESFSGKMINIHPALLPSFPGLHAQKQAVEYGVKVSGCTVHFVDELMDHGPIILQACVPVHEHDDEDALAGRILQEEHHILPEAVRLFCEGRLLVHDRKVCILPP
jgi:phosphoribosylglycinamide formyltransferase-1